MSLVSQVTSLATRIATEFKAVYSDLGDLASLDTSDKTNLVNAINEAMAATGEGITNLTTSHTASNVTVLSDTGTDGTINTATTSLAGVMSAAQATALGTALQPAVILDQNTMSSNSPDHVPTQRSTKTYVDNAVAALVNGSSAALDTLKELADALGGDAAFSTTITTALGNRLRFDAAQTLTGPQQAQGQTNLQVYSRTEIGNPETDFITVFEAGLV